ncbi:hypothetical protein PGTDC60_2093 [Porphyromonas gingivalis TDC60]|nr:hypothetical protein PGTDC60_2093 [Porphyromonas gingivalis TDC60]
MSLETYYRQQTALSAQKISATEGLVLPRSADKIVVS